MENLKTIPNETIISQMNELDTKFKKMRALAEKIAEEMDDLAEKYAVLQNELNNRKNN